MIISIFFDFESKTYNYLLSSSLFFILKPITLYSISLIVCLSLKIDYFVNVIYWLLLWVVLILLRKVSSVPATAQLSSNIFKIPNGDFSNVSNIY